MATVGFANGALIKTPHTRTGPDDDKNKKLLQIHKQITLFSFTIFSIPADTVSTIANFGSIDRFRKATAPDPEPNKIR